MRQQREAAGRAARKQASRSAHGDWQAVAKGRDPVAILAASDAGRIPQLLPLRYGRMLDSPFAFLRGAAAVMAFDLSRTPVTGLRVQACGDCHVMNFGAFATPERNLVFDLNDFDETLPAPWEWDIKRLVASIMVAGRHRGFADRDSEAAVLGAVRTYRTKMAEYAAMPVLEIWYAHIDARNVVELGRKTRRSAIAAVAAPYTAARMLPKLTEVVDGRRRIKDDPPLLYHPPRAEDYSARIRAALRSYHDSLPPERRALLDHYQLTDIAMKVVGVGSVGLRCAVALFLAAADDPLFLQFKEARASVLEPYAGHSAFRNQGERVVVGQRFMQSASDMFLGWSRAGRPAFDFYVRQLREMKVAVDLDGLDAAGLTAYAQHCAWATARAHAKTGDPVAISSYLGTGDVFDKALVRFAKAYAAQTERDHAALGRAVARGQVRAVKDASRAVATG